MVTELPAKTDTVTVHRDVHFEQIAQVLHMSVDQLQELNPQYRRNIVNGSTKPSIIKLPSTKVNLFIDNEEAIYAYQTDSLLSRRSTVAVNQEYVEQQSKKSKKSSRSRGKSVTIRQGDTLSEIAARNHTTVAKLKKLNKISGTNIRAGKKIRVK